MLTLSVLGVEDGAIIATAPSGERFRLPIDAALRARLLAPVGGHNDRRLSPREIQAHVRSGLTPQQVAALTGTPVAYIERFTPPVLAERAYVVESALAVRLPPATEGARARTFGAVMGERLAALAASEVRWTSAKEASGWVLGVAFTADGVQHRARWRFDPKRLQLEPDDVEASTLSQHGVPPALTPRLRAIEPTGPIAVVPAARPVDLPADLVTDPSAPDRSRFDSAAFRFPAFAPDHEPDEERPAARRPRRAASPDSAPASLADRRGRREPPAATGSSPMPAPTPRGIEAVRPAGGDVFAARPRSDRPAADGSEAPVTRGRFPVHATTTPTQAQRREASPSPSSTATARASASASASATRRAASATGAEPAVDPPRRRRDRPRQPADVTMTEPVDPLLPPADEPGPSASRPRRGRTSMPSWDEIVFGRDEP